MRNAWFHHPSLQDSVFLHRCCFKHTLQGSTGLWCTGRGGASSLTLLQCLSSPSSAHSWAHTGFALQAHPDTMSLMTSQSQTSRYAAATSPPFGFYSFPTSRALPLAKHGEGVGTRYYDSSLRKKTFLIFVSFLPVTGFRSSFQSKDIFKSQVLQKGRNRSL